MIRLQKFLADAGVASRRKAETLITDGKIKVNGKIITTLGTKVSDHDEITYQDKTISLPTQKTYLALHKPAGYITSASDSQGQTVMTLVKQKIRLFPVGRLDKDSSGLLIMTNDGEFANKITHAKFGCEKEYFVVLDQDLKSQDIKILERGMTIAGKKLSPVKVANAKNKSARLILKEGINRQIRRALGKLGYTVYRLKRVRIGKLELGELKSGQTKPIKPSDVI